MTAMDDRWEYPEGPRGAVLIGNNSYQPWSPLSNPINDIRLIENNLQSLRFDVTSFADVDFRTFPRVLGHIRDLSSKCNVFVLFYAGHGIAYNNGNFQESYLIPIDAKIANTASIQDECWPLSRFLNAIHDACSHQIIVCDACRDVAAERTFIADSPYRSMQTREIGLPIPRSASNGRSKNIYVLFSTALGSTASDGAKNSNSPFAKALSQSLELPDREFLKVCRDVIATVGEGNKHQKPELSILEARREDLTLKRNAIAFLREEARFNWEAFKRQSEDRPEVYDGLARSIETHDPALAKRIRSTGQYFLACSINTLEAYDQFLKTSCNSDETASASQRRLALVKKKEEEAERRDFELATSVYDLRQLEKRYPRSQLKEQITRKIEFLLVNDGFATAAADNTVASWRKFLKNFPGSHKSSEAEQALRDAQELLDYNKAVNKGTVWAYRGFLKKHPNGHFAEHVNELLHNHGKILRPSLLELIRNNSAGQSLIAALSMAVVGATIPGPVGSSNRSIPTAYESTLATTKASLERPKHPPPSPANRNRSPHGLTRIGLGSARHVGDGEPLGASQEKPTGFGFFDDVAPTLIPRAAWKPTSEDQAKLLIILQDPNVEQKVKDGIISEISTVDRQFAHRLLSELRNSRRRARISGPT